MPITTNEIDIIRCKKVKMLEVVTTHFSEALHDRNYRDGKQYSRFIGYVSGNIAKRAKRIDVHMELAVLIYSYPISAMSF